MPDMKKKSDVDELVMEDTLPMEVQVAEALPGSYQEEKTVYRAISVSSDPQVGIFNVLEVDDYVSSYMKNGWDLFSAQCMGTTSGEGGVPILHMVYVLVR